MRAHWLLAAALVVACGKGAARSLDVLPPADAGSPDSGAPVDAGPVDAGGIPDAGPADAGGIADAGPADAGPADAGMTRLGTIVTVPDSTDWHFASAGLPSGSVMGASMDEGDNL